MAEEAAIQTTETATAPPVETGLPANDTTPADPKQPANDNAVPEVTEAEVIALAERYGPEKALQIIARKLNYAVDGQSVSVAERKQFRDEQREAKRALKEWQEKIAGEWDGKIKEHLSEVEYGRALKAARETGDYDGLARGLGFKDWNELADDHIAKLADPNHKRLTELERKLQEKERAEQEALQRHQQTQAEQQKQAQIQSYKGTMAAAMRESANPVLKAMANFPDVVNMLFAVQQANYKNGSTVTLEDALRKPLPGGTQAVELILKDWHTALSEAFKPGDAPAAPAAADPAAKARASGKTAPTPTPAGSAQKNKLSDKEWRDASAQALEEAIRAEDQARAEERRKGANGAT